MWFFPCSREWNGRTKVRFRGPIVGNENANFRVPSGVTSKAASVLASSSTQP